MKVTVTITLLTMTLAEEVVVIGSGLAGIVSAFTVVENRPGAHVTIFDTFECGGDSSYSGGVIYAGGGTRVQKNLGVDDTKEKMMHYVRTIVPAEFVEEFVEKSAENFDWIYERYPDMYSGTLDDSGGRRAHAKGASHDRW
jgi:3-oxo-5alpha-steroid 4-dehydrogenase